MLKPPFQVEYHERYFPSDEPDDRLPVIGSKNWTVIGIIGIIPLFFKACEQILQTDKSIARPFVYQIKKTVSLKRIKLPA
jgi:hypothetical protein